jgi:hypothetical protein
MTSAAIKPKNTENSEKSAWLYHLKPESVWALTAAEGGRKMKCGSR